MSPNQIRVKEALAPKLQCLQQVFQCTDLVTGIDTDKMIMDVLPAEAAGGRRQLPVAASGTMLGTIAGKLRLYGNQALEHVTTRKLNIKQR